MGIQSREVKQRHAVYHEAGQMLGRQTVAQPHRQIERLLVVHGFEGSTHAQQYTISDAGAASLRQTASHRFPTASKIRGGVQISILLIAAVFTGELTLVHTVALVNVP